MTGPILKDMPPAQDPLTPESIFNAMKRDAEEIGRTEGQPHCVIFAKQIDGTALPPLFTRFNGVSVDKINPADVTLASPKIETIIKQQAEEYQRTLPPGKAEIACTKSPLVQPKR